MENKIVTLENDEKYLIFTKMVIENNEFLVGIKLENDKYINEFKVFTEEKRSDKTYLELVDDENLIKVILNNYLLDKIKQSV